MIQEYPEPNWGDVESHQGDSKMWLCALYERECPCADGDYCQGCKEYLIRDNAGHTRTISCLDSPCSRCDSTGRIPLLEGVREELGHQHCKAKGFCTFGLRHLNPLRNCHGLGWTPVSTTFDDAWKWFEAMRNVFPDEDVYRHYIERGKDAFFRDVYECLSHLAVNAAEAEKWVRERL